MIAETSELRSGITSAFNKRLNEALQFNPQMGFNIENTVTPSQTIAVLKGEQGTPGLPAAISAVKDDNNAIALATSNLERGTLILDQQSLSITGTSTFTQSFVVPEGHKYLVKGASMYQSGGTFTVSTYQVVLINPVSKNMSLYSSSSAPVGSTQLVNSGMIYVPAGWTVGLRVITTAHSVNGAIVCTLLYQDITI